MDYSKLTKQELLDELLKRDYNSGNEEKIKQDLKTLTLENEELQKALKDQIKARDAAIASEHSKGKELDVLKKDFEITNEFNQKQKEVSEKNYKFLENRFNEMAELFQEYINAYKNHMSLSEAILKNGTYVVNALDLKIKKFNGNDSV
jgi:hypothetical protein